MSRKYIASIGLLLLLAAFGAVRSDDFLAHFGREQAREQAAAAGELFSPLHIRDVAPEYFALITQPGPGNTPVLEKINAAQKSVDVVMYIFEDDEVIGALGRAVERGVAVRVLLNGGYYDKKEKRNDEAFEKLQSAGVAVRWTPTHFALTHQKTLVFDGREAMIMTFNLTPRYYKTGRDFAVVNSNPTDVAAIQKTFNADWEGRSIVAPQGDSLVWSPGSEDALLYLINSATSTLDIYNQLMGDADIIEALKAAAARGVRVRVNMTYATNWRHAFISLRDAGVEVRTFPSSSKTIYIHAKMIIKDGRAAFIGSENFSETSMNKNRELGLVLSAPHILSSLQATFDGDWARSRPFTMVR